MTAPLLSAEKLSSSIAMTYDVLAWEVELAGARCILLDTIIGETFELIPQDRRERLLEGLHAVDLLSQHLTGLSAFVRRLSEVAPTDGEVEVQSALDDVTLGALADRMASAFGACERGINDADRAGDLDLF